MTNLMHMVKLFLFSSAISLALLVVVIIGFAAIEMMRDWINSKNLSVNEKDSLMSFSKDVEFYSKLTIGFGFFAMIGINPIIGFIIMVLAAIVLRAADVLKECSHYSFKQCRDLNQDLY